MAKRRYEFRPDKVKTDPLSKLYLTAQQRSTLLRWVLHGALLVTVTVLQNAVLGRLEVLGAGADLVPGLILLMCVRIGADRGAVYALAAALFYQYSGGSPGYYALALIPTLALVAAMIRQSYFRRSFRSVLLCALGALAVYELGVFCCGLIFGNTVLERWLRFFITAGLTALSYPLLYPLICAIEKIGEKTWKD